jgi:hypothetical protein
MQYRRRSQPTHIWPLHSGSVTSVNAEQGFRRWGKRQTLAAVVVAAAIGGVGGAAVYAATEGSSHAMASGMRGPVHGPPPPGGQPAPMEPPPPGVLHSESVVSDGQGGYATKMTQTGTVDEVTLSSIVVRSDDGYTQIYDFPSSAVVPKPTVTANDTVTVQATRTGPTVTLNSIGEGPPPGN